MRLEPAGENNRIEAAFCVSGLKLLIVDCNNESEIKIVCSNLMPGG